MTPILIERSQKGVRLVLPAVVDLGRADDLIAALREVDGTGEAYAVDGSAVTRIATPCLQPIVAALMHNDAARLVAPSTALSGTIADLGLHPHLTSKMEVT